MKNLKEYIQTSHIGITVLAVVLFLASCDMFNRLDPPTPQIVPTETGAVGPLTEGMGRVVIGIEGEGATAQSDTQVRSVMPSSPVFTKFTLLFHCTNPSSGVPGVTVENIPAGGITGSARYAVELTPGTWTISATGFITENGVD
jgi:hypothetical protein